MSKQEPLNREGIKQLMANVLNHMISLAINNKTLNLNNRVSPNKNHLSMNPMSPLSKATPSHRIMSLVPYLMKTTGRLIKLLKRLR